jgi:hypothetical protein
MKRTLKSGGKPRPRLEPRDKQLLVEQLRRDACRIAEHFQLTYQVLEAENARVTARYGSFDTDGVIKIRLTHVRTGRPLKYSSMIDTLCHELAHTKHFHHGVRFHALYERILAWAREAGIYRPTPRGVPRAEPLHDRPRREPVAVAAARVAPAPEARRRKPRPPRRPELEQLNLF